MRFIVIDGWDQTLYGICPTLPMAIEMRNKRNEVRKPKYRTVKVYELVEVA